MKTVYIDCTSSVPIKNQPFHGGLNYTHSLLLELNKRNHPEHEFVLLLPTDYSPKNAATELIYNSGFFKTQVIEALSDNLKLKENSTLFLPLLYKLADYKSLKKIKHTNPTVKIVATIHDMRHLFSKFGNTSRYFYTGLLFYFYFLYRPIHWLMITLFYSPAIRRGMREINTIFTDSNYSLQEIINEGFKGNILPHYLAPKPRESNDPDKPEHKYFLFVSGNRAVKNLLRTLEAFCMFKETDNNEYYLYVTGITGCTMNNLLRYKKINKDIVEKWVRVFGYVDDEELDSLYRNCSVLLFTSLSEGFGLPILEAAQYNKPSISSYTSSMPEVLGSCTYYIDPYSVKSIFKGMEYLSQENNIKQYEKWLSECYPILEKRNKIDLDVVFYHITSS
ncbi:MAG: glycosyltransferase family 4 protein [Oscillospiraceae bacterium]|nr:glycosyltransferase family 4 protein [Oscillospiraceae bacterium]